MSKVEILLATMHRQNTDFLQEMNIQTDIVVANQAESFDYSEAILNGYRVRFATTGYRGVGKNRNLALAYSSGEILLFADDDLRYVDGYNQLVEKAFEKLQDADAIIFNINLLHNSRIFTPYINNKITRVNLRTFARYGAVRIAIKHTSLKKANLCFSELFGGGCIYGSGEDTVFLSHALHKDLKIYAVPDVLCDVNQDKSSWFSSYDEKFMFDKGALIATAFPNLKWIYVYYFANKFSRKSTLSFIKTVKLMFAGMRAKKFCKSYADVFGSNESTKGEKA